MKNKEEYLSLQNKLEVFMDSNLLKNYVISIPDFLEAFEYLNDEEKISVIKTDFFEKQTSKLKLEAVKEIKDDKLKLDLLKNESFCSANCNYSYQKLNIIDSLSEDGIEELLKNSELLKKWEIHNYQIEQIISKLGDDKKMQLILSKELTEVLGLEEYSIISLISKMNDDRIKLKLMNKMKFSNYQNETIIKTLSPQEKSKVLVDNTFELRRDNIINIISSMETKECVSFFNNNEQFLNEKSIRLFDVVRRQVDPDKQLEILYNMDKFNLSEIEKRKIVAGLKNETKEIIDFGRVDEKYKKLAELKLEDDFKAGLRRFNKIKPDLNSDLSIYKDLDEIISVMPQTDLKTDYEKEQFKKLCELCPNMSISDILGIGFSTVSEYIEGEKWIDSVIGNLKNDWNQAQKMAYIHIAIGKRLSYTPEQGTEVENPEEERPIWKIITNKNGICNGIAQLEQYMLGKIGIESEMVSANTHTHAFLKVKNVEIPTADGVKKGNTILDPTWDLANSRFNARLHHFCRNYEEIRKFDINYKGEDRKCHENKDLENEDLIEMDEQSLRKICTSIGAADKDGNFLVSDMMNQVDRIDELCFHLDSNIYRKIGILKNKCPEFAECINSSIKIMQCILFPKSETFNYKKCVVSRVYDKSDVDKKAVLFAYFDFDEKGKRFYYADKEKGEFIGLSQENFEKRFDCYESDMKENKRLWEQEEEKEERLETSSGKIVEGDER